MKRILIILFILVPLICEGQMIGRNRPTRVQSMVDPYGPELIVGGNFNDPANWICDANWSVTGGKCVRAQWGTDTFYPAVQPLSISTTYHVVFTLSNVTNGSVQIVFGGTVYGTSRNADGTYAEDITTNGTNANLIVTGANFFGSFDDFSIKVVL